MLQKLKNNAKTIIASLVGWVFFIVGLVQCHRQESRFEQLEQTLKLQNESFKSWQSKDGKNHAQNAVLVANDADMARILMNNTEEFKNFKNDFEGIKKNLKNLQLASKTTLQSHYYTNNFNYKDTVVKDTAGKYFNTSSTWYQVNGLVANNKIIDLNIYTKDSLAMAVYWHRKWLFGKKRYTHEIINTNPYNKITYNKSLILIKKRTLF
ncbi:MAG: DUF6549 family protein [Cytophagales bacterium]